MSNTDIWDKLSRTDPKHTKAFNRAGGFKGTAIKPIYTSHKMTEVFGPAGQGWGMGKPDFQVVAGNDGQVAVYCTVELWWDETPDKVGTTRSVYGVGGDMVVVKQSNGLRTDDEAFKKAFTDAVGNAMKHLGMSADVHMGLFDDSKYVSELREEARAASSAPSQAPTEPVQAPKTGFTYQEYSEALTEAEDVDHLKSIFAMIWRDPGMSAGEKDNLRGQYKRREEKLTQKPTSVPPNFDSLAASGDIPYPDRDELQEALNMNGETK